MKPAAPAAELRYFDGSLFVLGELAGTIAEAIVETVFRQDGASRQSFAATPIHTKVSIHTIVQ